MQLSKIIVMFAFFYCISCKAKEYETNVVQPVKVVVDSATINKRKLNITLRIQNTSNKSVVYSTFYKGRFEPIFVTKGNSTNVVAKQGGWDLVKVKPYQLNLEGELKKGEFKTKNVECISKSDFDSILDCSVRVRLHINGRWHGWTLDLPVENNLE